MRTMKSHCFDRIESDRRQARSVAHDTATGHLHSSAREQTREILSSSGLHPKIEISSPDNACELEADRIAEQVMGNSSENNQCETPAATVGAGDSDGITVKRKSDCRSAASPEECLVRQKSDNELMEEANRIEDEIREKVSAIALEQRIGSKAELDMESLVRQQASNLLERAARANSPLVLEGVIFDTQTLLMLGGKADAFANDILMVLGLSARKMGLLAVAQMLPGADVFSDSDLKEGGEWLKKEEYRLRSLIFLNNLLIQHASDRISRTADPAQKHELRKSLEPLWTDQGEYEAALKFIEENVAIMRIANGSDNEDLKILPKPSQPETPVIMGNLATDLRALKGGGHPLPSSQRAFFEPRMNADFGNVRIHTDAKAAELAKTIRAQAFAIGNDIAFSEGKYAPESLEGRRLIAHELAHVGQQSGENMPGGSQQVWRKSDAADSSARGKGLPGRRFKAKGVEVCLNDERSNFSLQIQFTDLNILDDKENTRPYSMLRMVYIDGYPYALVYVGLEAKSGSYVAISDAVKAAMEALQVAEKRYVETASVGENKLPDEQIAEGKNKLDEIRNVINRIHFRNCTTKKAKPVDNGPLKWEGLTIPVVIGPKEGPHEAGAIVEEEEEPQKEGDVDPSLYFRNLSYAEEVDEEVTSTGDRTKAAQPEKEKPERPAIPRSEVRPAMLPVKPTKVHFRKNSFSSPEPVSGGDIAAIALMLAADPKSSVRLTGHASTEGETRHNYMLSKERCMTVKNMLLSEIKNGGMLPETVGDDRIIIRPTGEKEPLMSEIDKRGEDLKKARKENRCVEIEFL
jgi:outer membrane protein OmpA-like peptidoglycan-associated protein